MVVKLNLYSILSCAPKLIYKRGLLLVTFFTINNCSFGQENLDSLWKIWKNNSKHDTIRLNALHDFVWGGYLYSKPDSAFYFAELGLKFAKKKKLNKYIADELNTQGISFAIQGDFNESIKYFEKSLRIQEKMKNKKGIATALNNLGLIYQDQGNLAKAIEHYSKSLKIRESLGERKLMANALSNIGAIYLEQQNSEMALSYFNKSLKIDKEFDDKSGIAYAYNNIGIIYGRKKEPKKAISFYLKSLELRKELKDYQGIAASLNNIGNLYKNNGENAIAINYLDSSLIIYEKLDNKQGIARLLGNIGSLYFENKNYPSAINYSERSLTLAKKIGALAELKLSAENLWRSYKKTGQHKQSLEMYQLFISTRDTIQSENNQKEVIRQEFKYQYEKKATADSIINIKQQEIKNVEIAKQKTELNAKRVQQYFLFSGLALVIIFAFFIYNRFKITSRQKKIIEDQKTLVEEKQKEILDSIHYARRIQNALLPSEKYILRKLNNKNKYD